MGRLSKLSERMSSGSEVWCPRDESEEGGSKSERDESGEGGIKGEEGGEPSSSEGIGIRDPPERGSRPFRSLSSL